MKRNELSNYEKTDLYNIAQDVYGDNMDSRFPEEMLELAMYLYPDVNWTFEAKSFFNAEICRMAE